MNPTLMKLALASQQLGLLRLKMEARAADPETPQGELDQIALELPLTAQARRDLDREYNALSADNTLPMPDAALVAELDEATQDLSSAIAADETTDALIGLGQKVIAVAQQLS